MSEYTIFLLALVCVVFLIFLLQLLVQTTDNGKSDGAGEPDEENGAARDQGNDANSLAVAIADAIHTYRRYRQADDRSKSTRERRTIAILGITGIFALAAAAAGIISAVIFYAQLEQTREDGRAWLAVLDANFEEPVVVGKDAKIRIYYENTGREPALDVAGANWPYITEVPSNNISWIDIAVARNIVCDAVSLRPYGPIVYPSKFMSGNEEHVTLDKSYVTDDIINGRKAFYFEGCFAYKTLGRRKESGYCFVLRPSIGEPVQQWKFSRCNANRGD